MARNLILKSAIGLVALAGLGACGALNFDNASDTGSPATPNQSNPNYIETDQSNTIWSIFNRKDSDTSVSVNKYLWSASLEVLNFLPVQSVDPYTGVIVTGYGTPPGGSQSYRATVLIDDPALDARSLNIALQTSGGRAVNAATSRAVEDAILSRAREMRIADNKF